MDGSNLKHDYEHQMIKRPKFTNELLHFLFQKPACWECPHGRLL